MTAPALGLAGVRTPRGLVLRTLSAAPWLAGSAGALMVIEQAAQFTIPVLLGLAIDHGIAANDLGGLCFWATLLVLDFLVLVFAYQFGSRLGLRAVESVQHRLRLAVTDRLLSPTGIAGRRSTGELLSIAGSDVTRLSSAVLIMVFPVAEAAALVYAGIALTLIWWPLGVAVLAGGLVLVLTMEFVGRPFRERTEREQERIAGVAGVTADVLAGARTLRGFGAAGWALERHAIANEEALVATKRARAAEQRFIALSRGMSALLVVGIAVTAAYLAFAGEITVGQLVIAVGLVQLIIGPLGAIAINLATVWLSALASARRVLALLREPEARPEPGSDPEPRSEHGADPEPRPESGVRSEPESRSEPGVRPESEVRPESGVRPAHRDPEPAACAASAAALEIRAALGGGSALDRLAFSVSTGEVVGVVASARVADELVGMLRRCGAEDGERIVLSGVSTALLDSRSLAARILVASQRVAGTALPPASAAHRAAARVVTPAISGGELQRAALAHAYGAAAPVLVLHDPTSAIDPATEQLIADGLRAAVAHRATLVVTTSPALLAVTDAVLLVGERGLTAGSHRELLARSEYRGLIA